MSSPNQQDSRTAGNVVVDTVLTLLAWAFFTWICMDHVPDVSPTIGLMLAAAAGSCMAGVFWLAWQMFRVVLRGQRDDNAGKK